MIMDIDFENYSVEEGRASEIRSVVERLRQESWVADLRLLLAELGSDESDESQANAALPGLLKEADARVYHAPAEHPAHGLLLSLQGSELKVFYNGQSLLEITTLPKGSEYAIFYLNEARFDEFAQLMSSLSDEFKRARSAKSERAAAFKNRFESTKSD
jgi:hypothetical protein